jgi:hypothetical protein
MELTELSGSGPRIKCVGITAAVTVLVGQLLRQLLGVLLGDLLDQPYRPGYSATTRL